MNNPWIDNTKPDWLTEEIQKAMDHYQYPHTLEGLLMLQQKAKVQLDFWKETELEWRKLYASLIPSKHEGTNTIPLSSGAEAKVVIKYNYKLDSDNDKIWACLEKIANVDNEGKFIADRLISWTPNFLKTEYTTLQEEAEKGSPQAKEILKIVGEMLTITDAAPTVEIKEPKKKK